MNLIGNIAYRKLQGTDALLRSSEGRSKGTRRLYVFEVDVLEHMRYK